MGRKNYHGPVDTIEQAMMAGLTVTIHCQRCSRWRSRWAWKICETAKHRAPMMRFNQPISGFYCQGCRQSVTVVITKGAH